MSRASIKEWGNHGWLFLHSVTFAWHVQPTNAQRRTMHRFLHSFAMVLPCPKCSMHFQEYVTRTVPTFRAPALMSRYSLARWAWDAHNDVNVRLQKTYVPSFVEVASQYGMDENMFPPILVGSSSNSVPFEVLFAAITVMIVIAIIIVGSRRCELYLFTSKDQNR